MKTYNYVYPYIYSYENLVYAYRKLKKKSASAFNFRKNLEENISIIQKELEEGTYCPKDSSRVFIKERYVNIPSFRDRLVQQALLQVLNPLFERTFISDSYAFIKGRGTHAALKRFRYFKGKIASGRYSNSGFILKADVKNYFPSVDQNILLSIIERRIKDRRVIELLNLFLKQMKGIGIGHPLSRLLANIYLNELDYFVKHFLREKHYLRYCDDTFVLKRRKKPLENVKTQMEKFLNDSLNLELNKRKTKIYTTTQGVDILGYKEFYFYSLLRKRNVSRFKKKLELWREEFDCGELTNEEFISRVRG